MGSAVLGEPSNPSRPGKLIVNFDSQPSFARSSTTNYNVVDTDYNSYAIVYSCGEKVFGLLKSEFLWILTRSAQCLHSPSLPFDFNNLWSHIKIKILQAHLTLKFLEKLLVVHDEISQLKDRNWTLFTSKNP